MIDCNLLKSPSLLLSMFSAFFSFLGLYTPFFFIKERGLLDGIHPNLAKWFVSFIGISSLLGRLATGGLSSFPRINILLLNNVSLTVAGVATLISGLYISPAYQCAYAVVFGFSFGELFI